jgi:hypothetical protein
MGNASHLVRRGAPYLVSTMYAVALLAGVAGCGEVTTSKVTAEVLRPPRAVYVLCLPVAPRRVPSGIDARALLGLSVQNAMQRAKAEGCQLRIVEDDGNPLPEVADRVPWRINVDVVSGRVVQIDGIG